MVQPPKTKKIKIAANPKCRGAAWKRREEKKETLKTKEENGKRKEKEKRKIMGDEVYRENIIPSIYRARWCVY